MVLKPLEISDNVFWVGAIDWEERDFHDFEIVRGATYNAYLIIDEKITLIDTVKDGFLPEMLERMSGLADLRDIDYIIANHVELDHSGSLEKVKHVARNAEIICTKKGKEGLCRYYNCSDWKFNVVKTGDVLKTGRKTLTFLEMAMLHWPDSMATYVNEDKLLLSNDAFGQHVASSERYDIELGIDESLKWAKLYYANILLPLSKLVKRKLEEVKSLGIEIKTIAPSHGIIWKNPSKIIEAYSNWAEQISEDKLVIVYDTMWKSTSRLAQAIAEGAKDKVDVRLFRLRKDSNAEIMTEILDSKAVAIGSPTMHNRVFPPVSAFLTLMRGLKPQNKIGLAFGSYGWGGGAVKDINKVFEELKFQTLEPFSVKYRPDKAELEKAYDLGSEIADMIKSK